MKLFEGLEKYGHQMHLALSAMMKDMFDMNLTDDKAREIIDTLALSDMLKLDTAIDDNDTDTIMDMLGNYIEVTEYSLPNRGNNLKSQASQRPQAQKTGGGGRTTTTTKPVAGGNKVATGGVASIGQDDKEDPETPDNNAEAEKEITDKQAEIDALKKKAGLK